MLLSIIITIIMIIFFTHGISNPEGFKKLWLLLLSSTKSTNQSDTVVKMLQQYFKQWVINASEMITLRE